MYIYIYIYIYIVVCIYIYIYHFHAGSSRTAVSSCSFDSRKFESRVSRIPEPLLAVTSKCPLKLQISRSPDR